MARVRAKARIGERSTSSGPTVFTLAGAWDNSYNRFSSIMAVGDTTKATVVEPGVAFWAGYVTYSATNEITLTTVEESKGTFGSGTKEIFAGPLASTSMFPEDISGAIVTGGTSTAYTVTSFRVYDTLTRLNGNIIAFSPHTTSGAAPTLNVDGLGAKPLRAVPGADLLPGVLIQGTPYLALYNHTDGVCYLHGMFGNPYNVPLAAGLDYWGFTAPNSAFAYPAGQAISRVTYAALWNLIGGQYGSGDGSTTFNLPDKSGRVSAMKEATATRLTTAGSGVDGGALGSPGGAQNVTLAASQIPSLTSVNAAQAITVFVGGTAGLQVATSGAGWAPLTINSGASFAGTYAPSGVSSTGVFSGSNNISTTYTNGSQAVTRTVQPTIVCNYIMRVL